jgi:hypothetical protein
LSTDNPVPGDPSPDDLAAAIHASMERAAISGLCREGQLELALQAARELRPDLGEDELRGLIEAETGG